MLVSNLLLTHWPKQTFTKPSVGMDRSHQVTGHRSQIQRDCLVSIINIFTLVSAWMRNILHRLIILNVWSLIGGLLKEESGRVGFWEKVAARDGL